MFQVLLCCFVVVSGVLSFTKPAEPCRRDDNVCLTALAQLVYASAVEDSPDFQIDPLPQDKIEGNLPTLLFTLTDTITKGFKICEIRNMSIAADKSSVNIEMFCPKFEMNGHYEADGTIENAPFQGKGGYSLLATDYIVYVHAILKSTIRDDQSFIHVVDFDVDAKLKGDLDMKLENLFNGNKDLSAATHNFIKENPDFTANFLQKPVLMANINTVVQSANKFLEDIPIDGLID